MNGYISLFETKNVDILTWLYIFYDHQNKKGRAYKFRHTKNEMKNNKIQTHILLIKSLMVMTSEM